MLRNLLKELAVVEYALLCELSLTLYLCSLWSGDEKSLVTCSGSGAVSRHLGFKMAAMNNLFHPISQLVEM